MVAVCDMDNFKDVNDRYGHLVGDEILRNIGHLLQSSIRHADEAFRWGGDEFVILFQNQHAEIARRRMTRDRSAAARFPGARIRHAADHVQLGNCGGGRPVAARHAGRGRPQYVRAEAHAPGSVPRKTPGAHLSRYLTAMVVWNPDVPSQFGTPFRTTASGIWLPGGTIFGMYTLICQTPG